MTKFFGDIFNTKFKNDAQKKLEQSVNQYNVEVKALNDSLEDLQLHREQLSQSLRKTESLIDNLKNTPITLNNKIDELKINLSSYDELLKSAEIKSAKSVRGAATQAATGLVPGTGIGVLGGPALPPLAMSVGTA